MKRRNLLTALLAGGIISVGGGLIGRATRPVAPAPAGSAPDSALDSVLDSALDTTPDLVADAPAAPKAESAAVAEAPVDPIRDREGSYDLDKVRNFENEFVDDIHLDVVDQPVLASTLKRMKAVERLVGHGNYNLISFDDLLRYARRYSRVGAFTPAELNFLEKIFFAEAEQYGFLGEKVQPELTARILKKDTYKVPYSGHYLFRGESLDYYNTLKKDVGEGIILTSGIRSNVKQMHLFLSKAVRSDGNLSKASRSLAPPGHSFHGIGDFDVGKVGFGVANFTDSFAETDEFKRMLDLGYVQIRYTEDNRLGVRFEPWHIKVV